VKTVSKSGKDASLILREGGQRGTTGALGDREMLKMAQITGWRKPAKAFPGGKAMMGKGATESTHCSDRKKKTPGGMNPPGGVDMDKEELRPFRGAQRHLWGKGKGRKNQIWL